MAATLMAKLFSRGKMLTTINTSVTMSFKFQLYSGLKGGQISQNRLVRYLDQLHADVSSPDVSRTGGGL